MSMAKPILCKLLVRHQVATGVANLSPCLVGMEACGSAHFWARKPEALRHEIRLMAPQFVKPYVKGSKTDAVDAEAIFEAKFSPIGALCR
jgi:transposase